MRRETWYFLVGAVVAVLVNRAIGIEFPTSIASATGVVFVTVVVAMLVDRRRGRPSTL